MQRTACMISARAILPSRDRLGASHASGHCCVWGWGLTFRGGPSALLWANWKSENSSGQRALSTFGVAERVASVI